MSDYVFGTTSKLDKDTYVVDNGFWNEVKRGDKDFDVIDAKFGAMLEPNQTARKGFGDDDSWEVIDGIPMLSYAKENKLRALNAAFLEAEKRGVVSSAVGFDIDATERSNRDIAGLITAMESGNISSVDFCDAHNQFHKVSLAQLKTMQMEVIQFAQNLYAKKWVLRSEINAAIRPIDVSKVVISF